VPNENPNDPAKVTATAALIVTVPVAESSELRVMVPVVKKDILFHVIPLVLKVVLPLTNNVPPVVVVVPET
jgi:hypothetical protein